METITSKSCFPVVQFFLSVTDPLVAPFSRLYSDCSDSRQIHSHANEKGGANERKANLSTFSDRHYDTASSPLIGFRRHTIMAGVKASESFITIYFVLLLLTFITLTRYIDKVYGCIGGKNGRGQI